MIPLQAPTDTRLSAALAGPAQLAEDALDRANKTIDFFKQQITAIERQQDRARTRPPRPPKHTSPAQVEQPPQTPAESNDEPSLDALRLVVHLFKTEATGHRNVGVMSRALKMERKALLDCLQDLRKRGLAESDHGNHRLGHLYWALTPEGKQYAVEHPLCAACTRPPVRRSRLRNAVVAKWASVVRIAGAAKSFHLKSTRGLRQKLRIHLQRARPIR